jgi:hypothetical protein
MGLRTVEGVPCAELAVLPLAGLTALMEDGFVRRDAERLVVTRQGRPLLDRITAQLAG